MLTGGLCSIRLAGDSRQHQLGIVIGRWQLRAGRSPAASSAPGDAQRRAVDHRQPRLSLLVQSGESYQGAPLHDRQHPHDLFMELSASTSGRWPRIFGSRSTLAPVGEPAVGPVACPHRAVRGGRSVGADFPSLAGRTHIRSGVVTAGVFTRSAKLEASWFNGRERTRFGPTSTMQAGGSIPTAPFDRQSRTALERVRVVRLSEKSGSAQPRRVPPPNRRVALTTQPVGTRGTCRAP